MGLRLRKSIKLAPGVRINISKSGISTTIGKRGASVNVGKNGTYANLGIPGTGISVREKLSGSKANGHFVKNASSIDNISSLETSTSLPEEPAVSLTLSEWFWGILGMIVWYGGIILACWFFFKWLLF